MHPVQLIKLFVSNHINNTTKKRYKENLTKKLWLQKSYKYLNNTIYFYSIKREMRQQVSPPHKTSMHKYSWETLLQANSERIWNH